MSIVRCFGVTREPIAFEYMLIVDEMEYDLHGYIKENYSSLTWKDVNSLFCDIMGCIYYLHKDNIVHNDLHAGNILQSYGGRWCTSDFGLCGPADQKPSSIYGNLPYM